MWTHNRVEVKDGHSQTDSLYVISNHRDSQPAHLRGKEANVAPMVAIRKTFSVYFRKYITFFSFPISLGPCLFCNRCFSTVLGVQSNGTHSSILAWKIPWTEGPGRLQSMGSLSWIRLSDFTFTFHFSCIGEGNGNPVQCPYLENPRDRGAWWAAVYRVTQSRTRLK